MISVNGSSEVNGLITVKVASMGNLKKLGYIAEARRQSLNKATIKALARLDEIKVVLHTLTLLHWSPLAFFVVELRRTQQGRHRATQ